MRKLLKVLTVILAIPLVPILLPIFIVLHVCIKASEISLDIIEKFWNRR